MQELIREYFWIVGAVLVGLVLLKAMLITIDSARRVAHHGQQRKRELDMLDLRVSAAKKRQEAEVQKSLSWKGWRKFVVVRKEFESPDQQICSFYLKPHDEKAIPSFDPGQFLTFQLDIAGQSKPVVRCYSLSDAPRPDAYRVSIKRVPPPRDKPDAPPGLSSNHFHDNIWVGDILDVKEPSGRFFLDMANDDPVVLIGGGVGLTPVMSMLNAIIESGSTREVWFFYGIRNRHEHAMKTHLEAIARDNPNVHMHVCYSSPDDESVQGRDYHHEARVSVELFKTLLPSNNYDYYMCGPPPMMDSLTSDLEAWGVPKEKVHLESFGPSGKKKKPKPEAAAAAAEATGPAVTFRKAGKQANWSDAMDNLFEFADANEVHIDSGCLEGNCGTCQTVIVSGEVEYNKTPDFECESGTCLVCCCKPKGPLELDA